MTKLIILLDSFGLVQSVRVPTHRRGHTIDWTVGRADQSVSKSVVGNQTLPSDHFCLLFSHLHLSHPTPPPPLSPLPRKVYFQARNFTSIDMTVFNNNSDDNDDDDDDSSSGGSSSSSSSKNNKNRETFHMKHAQLRRISTFQKYKHTCIKDSQNSDF